MKPYRSLAWLATALSLAVVANLASQLLLDGLAARRAWLLTIVLACVLTLMFVHRAACNLEAIGDAHPRFRPWQCVGWLLVPVVNVWMAHQVLTALWRDSQPAPGGLHAGNADFSVRGVNVWFGITLAAMFAPSVVSDFHVTIGSLQTMTAALRIAQGVAYIVVALGLAARQREQWIDLERRRAVPQASANALR